ncbi:PoNe immunity protein domain-containing protein [Streptococcus fryi]
MLRDKNKDFNFFDHVKRMYTSYVLRNVENTNKVSEEYLATHFLDIALAKESLFKICYSLGENVDTIFEYYRESLGYFKDLITGNSDPYRIIDYFALGVLYSDRKSEFIDDLKVLYDNLVYTDDLIEYYAAYLFHDKIVPYRSALEYQNMIGDDFESIEKAQGFWYYTHSDAAWYGSHERDSYEGYWSFDTAATCKIKGIFDERLKELDYFPYDLLVQD